MAKSHASVEKLIGMIRRGELRLRRALDTTERYQPCHMKRDHVALVRVSEGVVSNGPLSLSASGK